MTPFPTSTMKVLITGAPGSGTSVLASALAHSKGWRHLETDHYQWFDSVPPFVSKVGPHQRRHKLTDDLRGGGVVVSGSVMDWGLELEDGFDLIVFLQVDTKVRLERIIARDTRLYGAPNPSFLDWASSYDAGRRPGRSRQAHEVWLASRRCIVLKIEGPQPVEVLLERIDEDLRRVLRRKASASTSNANNEKGVSGARHNATCDPAMGSGGFDTYLQALLDQESGLSSTFFDAYSTQLDRPAITYPQVERPGRPIRHPESGRLVPVRMTIRQYFEALGVSDRFDRSDPFCIERMQYRVINALGFVGYQFGEAILSETGHYEFATSDALHAEDVIGLRMSYRGGIDDSAWRGGCRRIRVDCGQGVDALATDVNEWKGRFTGKDGVYSLEDLRGVVQQQHVMRAVLALNHATLSRWLTDVPRSSWRKGITTSGLLAAAHLCGADATFRCLTQGRSAVDEFGTTIDFYLTKFSGYAVPYSDLLSSSDTPDHSVTDRGRR